MAVCYFKKVYDTDHKYKCEYELSSDQIVVTVDYDVENEIEAINGIKAFGPDTEYGSRDILIVDYDNRINYLLKDAYYCGHSFVYGSPDGGPKTTFASNIYLSCSDYRSLANLKETPKISSITIVSKDLLYYISESSVCRIEYDEKLVINLNKKSNREVRKIGSNNIREIIIQDYWHGGFNKDHDIVFDITGHLQLKLSKRVNYTDVPRYVYEILVFLQLYSSKRFNLEGVRVSIDGVIYDMCFSMGRGKKHDNKNTGDKCVQSNLLDFLEKCYLNIPYRNGKSDIRNIPYIVLTYERGIEDSFLIYYRFIECYYKKQSLPNIKKQFVSYCLNENYINRGKSIPMESERMANEIISLRNHYVHSGYYIKNESLRIKCDNSIRNYTAKADVEWIYERTKILYECAIDIIFRNMLGFDDYRFEDSSGGNTLHDDGYPDDTYRLGSGKESVGA